MRNKPRAFSMVELLVVIGIITLLISILVPALNRAKQSSENAKCLSNLRQLGVAAQMHSNDYHSRIPPAGVLIPASDEGKKPFDGFKNPFRELQWYRNGDANDGDPRPVPWLAAYAKYLAIPMRTDTLDHLTEDLSIPDRMKVFTCPSQRKIQSGSTFGGSLSSMGGGSISGPNGFTSYGFNEQIMGIDASAMCGACPRGWPTPNRRLFGRIQNLNNTSRVMLFGDAIPRSYDNIPGFFSFWDNATDTDPHIGPSQQDPNNWGTLAETLMEVPLIPKNMRDKNFDYERHNNRTMNIVFLDGHCEGVRIDELALREVIVDPIYKR